MNKKDKLINVTRGKVTMLEFALKVESKRVTRLESCLKVARNNTNPDTQSKLHPTVSRF